MPKVMASIRIPYALRLDEGDYPTEQPGLVLRVVPRSLLEKSTFSSFTTISVGFDQANLLDRDEILKKQQSMANSLLLQTNRLLRWYRATLQDAWVTELTRAQVGSFQFSVTDADASKFWSRSLQYDKDIPNLLRIHNVELTKAVREGLSSKTEPDVATLFLLDAERAAEEGRFREAVLFCWSTIDSTFTRKYDALVDRALAGEWAEGRDALKGRDLGLRGKMTAVLHLIAGRSLFREGDNLWARLTTSYNDRNGIIHRGKNATEDDAQKALDVARRIVDIMNTL